MKLMELSDLQQDELDRLLNDPDVPMEAARVWELLDELAARAQTEAGVASQ